MNDYMSLIERNADDSRKNLLIILEVDKDAKRKILKLRRDVAISYILIGSLFTLVFIGMLQ